ncbi:YecA family protein [Anoxybacillus ayderensis]|uniref:YecA family protein n=1 Tax=Anoxybacillus ayderensis TaxID=265546 RepID=UPI00117740FB|nr:SEC-C metal-binding domain-containing protein [Anoxybacillus ayderensis]
MKIGRNDPCFCGSGKKHKKCCLRKQHKKIEKYFDISDDELEFEQFSFIGVESSVESENITPYKIDKGINEYLAGLFDVIRQEFENSIPNKEKIALLIGHAKEFLSLDFINDYDSVKEKYIKSLEYILHSRMVSEFQFHISMSNAKSALKTDVSIRQVNLIKIVNEIVKIIESDFDDKERYVDFILLINIAIDLLVENKNKNEILASIQNPILEVYVNDKGQLMDYILVDVNEEQTNTQPVRIVKIAETKIYDILKDVYPKLSESGRIFLSKAEFSYKNAVQISQGDFDYSVCCTNYFECIEHELNYRVSEMIRIKFPCAEKNELTLENFVSFFREELEAENQIKGLNISSAFLNNLERIKNIRNKWNHKRTISLEECLQVREIVIDEGLISQICDLNITEKNILYCSEEEKDKILSTIYNVILLSDNPSLKIRQPILYNHYDAINFMNRLAFVYFNFNFHNPINLLGDRYIVSEIDYDKLGFLLIKKNLKDRQGIAGTNFDYLAHKNGKEFTELLFDCLIDFKEASGSLKVIYEKDRVTIRGNNNANELKKYLFSQLYIGEESDDKFKEILNISLDKCLEIVKENNIDKINAALRQILLTESIWKRFSDEVVEKYKLIRELVLAYISMLSNKEKVDAGLFQLVINSCRFIVNNTLRGEQSDYLYSYITFYATEEGEVLGVKFENSKSDPAPGVFFEFIYC